MRVDWDPIRRRMAESFFDLLHAAEAVEPSVDMTTYDLPAETGMFEVGARFGTHGIDPDEDPALEIHLSCSPYVHPPPDRMTEWRFSASENGRDVLSFWAGRHRMDEMALGPIVLPTDRDSAEYAVAVSDYVQRVQEQLRKEVDAFIELLTNG